MDSDRNSAEVDPEWKKNMGLLMNKQDGNVPHVSPRGAIPLVASTSQRERDRDINVYTSADDNYVEEHEEKPVEEYNFSFDDSRNSSHEEENLEQSISIRTRTVLNPTDEPGYSGSDGWAYERLGQASTPSTKTSHSELTLKADHETEHSTFNEPLDLSELEAFNECEGYPELGQGEEQMEQQQPTIEVTELEGEGFGDASLGHRSGDDAETCHMRSVGECQMHTAPATFARSIRSSRSSHPGRSPGHSPPASPPLDSPKASGSNQVAPSVGKNNSHRINENAMSFSFTIPNQPKYAQDWEWLEECKGVDAEYHEEVEQQPTSGATEIVLEGGRMRVGPTKLIKADLKRFKVQKKFRSQLDAMNSKRGGKSPNRMGEQQAHGLGTQEYRAKQLGPIPARLRHLSKPRTDLYQKFAHTRAQLEEEHMSECSFWPKVGRRPKPHSQHSAPLIQRVGGIEQRVDLRKRARKVIEKEELDQCSFWPQINSNSEWIDPASYKPIEERAMEYQRRKEAKLARARAKEDMEMGLTFRPEINPKSVKIFKQTGLEELNLEDRLTNAGSLHQDRKSKEMKGPKNECTFSPEINRNTDLIMRSSKLFEGCTPDFLSRQKYCMQVREMKQREQQQRFQTETLTFRPKTGNSDAILKDSPIAEMFEQSMYKRVDRLYHRDTERRQHIRQKISDAYYAQFSHQPEMDETSRLLGRSASVDDLYKNEKGKSLKEQIRTSIEQNFAKEHPFQPKLVARSPRRECDERMENVLHRRRQFRLEKARVLEEMKVIRELQEFKECTFKPRVNKLPPKDKEPVVVKGLGRHLELQDLAKQMKRDQEEWERKIFFQHVYSLPKRQYTIPKPFSLCAGRRSKTQQESADTDGGCVVQFKFTDRDPGIDLTTKKGPSMNTFYDEAHPIPANPKWKDYTIWPSPNEQPRFKHSLKEPALGS
ncbi:unnamed protein product [Calypogeia fissa]